MTNWIDRPRELNYYINRQLYLQSEHFLDSQPLFKIDESHYRVLEVITNTSMTIGFLRNFVSSDCYYYCYSLKHLLSDNQINPRVCGVRKLDGESVLPICKLIIGTLGRRTFKCFAVGSDTKFWVILYKDGWETKRLDGEQWWWVRYSTGIVWCWWKSREIWQRTVGI